MNKVVWITGASSGIGEAFAYEASRRGARLILSARRRDALEAVRERCADPATVRVLPLDLENPEWLVSLAAEAEALFGRIDILVNNGGISQRSLVRDTGIGVDERLLRVNYLGTVALTKAVLPGMLKNRGGQIVTVTSMVGKFGTPLRSSYSAAKHALHGFMDSLRAEESRNGIAVTLICPGFVATEISKNALTGDGSKQGTMDASTGAGIHPVHFARMMADAVESGAEEVHIAGVRERFGWFLKRFFPRVFSRMVARMAVT
jgi:short-subunit dehydrogenase